jgi:hypothetical protein
MCFAARRKGRNALTFLTCHSWIEGEQVMRICFYGKKNPSSGWNFAIVSAALFWLALFWLMPAAHAQYGGNLQGTITVAGGTVVPGAHVTLISNETNRTLQTTSNDNGFFVFNALAPSTYKIEIRCQGFKNKTIEDIRIFSEQGNSLNIPLEVGGSEETIIVNAAENSLIDMETGDISGTISQAQIAKLPAYGRDIFSLVQLARGVYGDGAQNGGGGNADQWGNQGVDGSGSTDAIFKTENRPQISSNGGRTDQNNITLDGISINSVLWGGSAVVTPSADSIKEMKVVANGYDAEFGRSTGAQIQVISQNGTNNFHGTSFFKIDRPGLNAYQRWDPNNNPSRDNARFNQFGGTIGGPILKNKLFGFFSYETIRSNSNSTGGGWFETADFDGLAPSSSIAAKYLGLTGAGAAYSKILEDSGDSHACADAGLTEGVTCKFIAGKGLDLGQPLSGFSLGTQDPSWLSNTTPGLGGDGTGSTSNFDGVADMMYVQTVNPTSQVSQQFNARVDYQATEKDLIAVSIYRVPQHKDNIYGSNREANKFHHKQTNEAETALWMHTFSSTMMNEFRADASGWRWNEITSNPQTAYGLPDDYLYSGDWSSTIGTLWPNNFGPSLGSIYDQWTYAAKDTLTKVYHNHNFRTGFQFTRLLYLDANTGNTETSFYFNNLWDFLNDAPSAERGVFDPTTGVPSAFRKDTRESLWAFFLQDDWKVKPNFTVNMGLRWEYFGPMSEKNGHLGNARLGSGSNLLTGIRVLQDGNEFDASKNSFGPQIGFAWAPSHFQKKNLVVRGGFGIAYSGLEEAVTTATRNNPPYVANNNKLTGSQIEYETANDLYAYASMPANANTITTFNANGLPTGNTAISITGLSKNLPTTYAYRYSLETQYDFGHQWVGTIGYQANMGRHLTLQTNNLNAAYGSAVLAGQMSYNPKLSYINWYENKGTSSFNALSLELQHQFSKSFEIDTQYRWSKSLDEGSGVYSTPMYAFAPGYEWGPSDFDVRHTGKIWGLWSPALFHNNWQNKLLGGWTFSGIMNMRTGYPWNPVYSGIACNAVVPSSGNCDLMATKYLGGASASQGTDEFKQPNGNFTKATSHGDADGVYFVEPTVYSYDGSWPTDGTAPIPTAAPTVPGYKRNSFRGPHYFDVDMTATKAFVLPKVRGLGNDAKFELRANAYNLFNKLNLSSPQSNILDSHFGRATSVFGSRTVEVEAHFKF